jgi:hypothetical protein
MEASHEDDDLFSLVNYTISYLLAVANFLWVPAPICCLTRGQMLLRFCDVVAWDAMIFGVCEI